jgi:hypothetical protein
MLVTAYQSIRFHNSDDHDMNLHNDKNLKSRIHNKELSILGADLNYLMGVLQALEYEFIYQHYIYTYNILNFTQKRHMLGV